MAEVPHFCILSTGVWQKRVQAGKIDRHQRQPQDRSQEPQGEEALGPRDSHAGPVCSS